LDLTAPLRQISAAVAANPLRLAGHSLEIVLQIRREDLGRQSTLREHDHLKISLEEFRRHAARLAQVRPPDSELMIDDWRIDEDEELLSARRAALSDELERALGEPLGQLLRIRNRRRGADKDRVGPVVAADATQSSQHIAQM